MGTTGVDSNAANLPYLPLFYPTFSFITLACPPIAWIPQT